MFFLFCFIQVFIYFNFYFCGFEFFKRRGLKFGIQGDRIDGENIGGGGKDMIKIYGIKILKKKNYILEGK